MSLPKKDRTIQTSSVKSYPTPANVIASAAYAREISEALHKEFGGTHVSVKTVVALTKANERAVKNWFAAKNGPTGRHLVDLVRTSDEVLETVLRMSGRSDLIAAKKLSDAKQTLVKMLKLISEM